MPTGILRIGGALCIGIVIVAGAFYLRSQTGSANGDQVAAVVSSEGRTYIESQDANGNGIRDWEEELREMTLRTAPNAPTYVAPATGASAEPNTLTERFSRSFFETYVRNDASGMMDEGRMGSFLDASIASLEVSAREKLFTKRDIIIGDDSAATLRAYGNRINEIIARHSFRTENEIAIFERALQNDSSEELSKLTNIADAYAAILTDTLEVSAPADLSAEHVALVNAYLAIKNDIRAMETSFSDPLYALIRVKRYADDVTALQESLKQIFLKLEAYGVVYEANEPGAGGRWYIEN